MIGVDVTVPAPSSRTRHAVAQAAVSAFAIVIAGVFACTTGTEPVNLDLARSTLAVAPGPYVAGRTYNASFTARDNTGASYSTPISVAFDLVGGTSDGDFSAATNTAPGVYTGGFLATVAGTASQLTATINGAALTGSLPTVTVIPGVVSLSRSTLSVAATQVAVGNTTTAMVTVLDALGNVRTGGGEVIGFTKGTGTSDGAFSATTDNANGTYTSTFTATTTGSARAISATIGGQAIASIPPTITVTAAPPSLALSMVTVGEANLASGGATTLRLTARTAAGVQLTTGGLVVAFTKGTGTSDGTISAVTDNDNGSYTATITATTAGTARAISATIGGAALTSAAPTVTVAPGAASTNSTVTVSTATVAVGSTATASLTARDLAGNLVTSGGATVAFTKGTGTSDGTLSAVTDNNTGTYTATFTASTVGTARGIGATVGGLPVTSTAPTITVTTGAVSTARSTVAVGSAQVVSGAATTLALTARDAGGNALTNGGLTVTFTKGAGTSDGTISAVTDNNTGSYSATFTATTAGTARTIGATIGGNAVSSTAPTITVTPGATSLAQSTVTVGASALASGASTSVTLTTRDAVGNLRTTGGEVVGFTKGAGTSDGTISAVTDNNTGIYAATFTATTAGTARTFGATVGGNAVTSVAPTITVAPGAASMLSTVTLSANSVASGASVTLALNARDLAGNVVTSGGDLVVFTKGSGTSDGTISTVTDIGNGSYTGSFTGTVAGTPRQIGATVNGTAITTALPSVLVLPPPTMALGADTVLVNVQINTTSSAQLVTVANIGSGSLSGLATTNLSLPGGAPQCASVNWLVTPTFDMGGVAAPLSLMSVRANATGLALGTCAREVTVTSATPDVTARRLVVVANVGRQPVAEGAVRVVMMGDAGNNSVQIIAPTPILTIDNGGRGTVTGVTATVVSTTGFAECVNSNDTSTCVPWLTNADLILSSTTLPTTLSIISQVRPFSATAVVRVQGNGMPTRDFPVSVFFNIESELVTNARNIMLKGRVGGTSVSDTVVAFNQNVANGQLTNYRVDPLGPAVPSWMTLTFAPQGNNATVIASASLTGFTRDTVISDTVGVRLMADCTIPTDCSSGASKRFSLAYALLVERGLVTSLSNATLFAPVGGAAVSQDVAVSNSGAAELSGLSVSVAGGASWLSAAFVGGSVTPATLRLTANPTGRVAGQYDTTITVSTGAGATLQTRTIPVRLTIF